LNIKKLLISFSATGDPGTPGGCGAIISVPGSEFKSENHPGNYPNNHYCTHLVKFAEGSTIRLEFLEFSLEHGGSRCR